MKSGVFSWAGLALLACLSARPAQAYGGQVWIQLIPGPIGYASGGAETYMDQWEYYYYYWYFGAPVQPVVEGLWFQNGQLIDFVTNHTSEGLTADVYFTGQVPFGCASFQVSGRYTLSIPYFGDWMFGEGSLGGSVCADGGGGGGGGGTCADFGPSVQNYYTLINGQQTNTVITGTSGTIHFTGVCLDGLSAAQVDGTGIQITGLTVSQVSTPYPHQEVNASYQAAPSSTGMHQITVTGTYGSSYAGLLFGTTLTVKQVSFTDGIALTKDTVGALVPISNPVWHNTSPPEVGAPVAYVAGSTMKGTIVFSLSPVNPPYQTPIPGGVRIEGQVPNFGKFVATGVAIPMASETPEISFTADTALPSMTRFYHPMFVSWYAAADGNPCSSQCAGINSTSDDVYVTLSTPDPTLLPIPLTVMRLAVSNEGASTPMGALQNTWALFSGPANINTWDNRRLYYYRNDDHVVGFYPASAIDVPGLLTSSSGSGECEALSQLLQDALAVNGIPSLYFQINTVDGSQMLIKNWAFVPVSTYPSEPVWKWQMLVGFPDPMVPHIPLDLYGDLLSLTGVPGQNSNPPSEKLFGNHKILAVNPTLGVGPYLDPSYGVTYTGSAMFEANAVAGYVRFFDDGFFHARQTGSGGNIGSFPAFP